MPEPISEKKESQISNKVSAISAPSEAVPEPVSQPSYVQTDANAGTIIEHSVKN